MKTPTRSDVKTLIAALRVRIETKEFAPGSRVPTERQLAEEYLASRATVRVALRALVEEGLVDQKAGCRPTVKLLDHKKEAWSSHKPLRIALWMHESVHDIGSTLIGKGVRRVANDAGAELIVCSPPLDAEATRRWARDFVQMAFSSSSIQGVILWASGDRKLVPVYQELIEEGISVVFIDRDPPASLNADVVAVDHFRGARTATQLLLDHGHRRIAMVSNDDRVSSVRDRVDGYYSALRGAGIAWDDDLLSEVSFVHAADVRGSADRVIERLMRHSDPPTAIFAVNDQVAMYLQDALAARDVRVPEDVSLVGFDWFLRWLPSGGDLTTVAQPFEAIGEVAARRLLGRIEGAAPHVSCHVLLPAAVVVKSTTAAPSESKVRALQSDKHP